MIIMNGRPVTFAAKLKGYDGFSVETQDIIQQVFGTNGSYGLQYDLTDKLAVCSDIGNCTDTDIEIGRMAKSLPVRTIGDGAFTDNENITSVVIPKSITYIGHDAFMGCSNLSNVTIEDRNVGTGVMFGDAVFAGCVKLTSIIIPDGVFNLSSRLFAGCRNLDSIRIPDSVELISTYTFLECESLTSITIPSNVKSIGKNAFLGCLSLTDVYYTGTEEEWDAITIGDNNDTLRNATIHYNYGG